MVGLRLKRAPIMLEPFEFGFMQRAMIAATLVGGVTAAVGVFVILRRLAYIGHGLAHSIFGGAVVSFTIGFNFFLGASLWGAFSVFLINQAARRRQIGGDAAIGIITTAAFAIGIAVISRARSFTRDFEAALFGEILGITNQDLYVTTGMIVLIALVLFVLWKPLGLHHLRPRRRHLLRHLGALGRIDLLACPRRDRRGGPPGPGRHPDRCGPGHPPRSSREC